MKQLKVVVIGAGSRGRGYTNEMEMLPEMFKVVAVAEPIESLRNYIKEKHNIADDCCFSDWSELLSRPKMADIAIISTMDRLHFEPAKKAMELKYNLLLEKPVAPTPKECIKLEKIAQENNVSVVVCHVLRYAPAFVKLKELIDSGMVGDIVTINHEEGVGDRHQSHSFVRGNWGNEERSSCMILQKSCHDMDILQWFIGKKCLRVQSFGGLFYFNQDHAPEGAPEYCIDGCPVGDKCPYNAVDIYTTDKYSNWYRNIAVHKVGATDEDFDKLVRTTQYGKCVFKCDNDVVDHQVVNLEFEGGTTATFTMTAFNNRGRIFHVMGTKGEIFGQMEGDSPFEYRNFETGETIEIPKDGGVGGVVGGHGGGDRGIMNALYHSVIGDYDGDALSSISISVENHMIAFAAEKSRKERKIIEIDEYIADIKANI